MSCVYYWRDYYNELNQHNYYIKVFNNKHESLFELTNLTERELDKALLIIADNKNAILNMQDPIFGELAKIKLYEKDWIKLI